MRHLICLSAALLLCLGGCGGDKPAAKAPAGTDTKTPNVDIDFNPGDGGGDADKGPADKGPADKGPADKGDADKGDADKGDADKGPADKGAAAKAPVTDDGWGHLEITFTADKFVEQGDAPGVAAANCGVASVKLEEVVIDPDTKALANVVIWLDEEEPKVHEDLQKLTAEKVVVDNLKCQFVPHVVSLWTKQTLTIGNKDAIGHNSKIDAFDSPSINPVIPPGGSVDAQFPNPELTPLPISCNIHNWMKGYVVVKGHPYVGVSDMAGKLVIKNLPAGKLKLRAWHETGYLQGVKVDGAAAPWKKGRFELEIPSGGEVKLAVEVAADSLTQ